MPLSPLKRVLLPVFIFALLVCLGAVRSRADEPTPWATPDEAQALLAEIKDFFRSAEVRLPGSPGNLAMEEKIGRLFADSGVRHGQIGFWAPCFNPGKANLTVGEASPIPLLPMHPTLFRPGNFPERDFEANLVYMGAGGIEDLAAARGLELDGAIAVLDMEAGRRWQALMRFGVKGFILLDSDEVKKEHALQLVPATEVSVPRYFVAEPFASELRASLLGANRTLKARLRSDPSKWANKILHDLWAFIPGCDDELKNDVVVITAPIDSSCVVPELAVGGQSGANLFLLARLFESLQKDPPKRSVVFAALNAETQYYRGSRQLAWHLMAPSAKLETPRNTLAADLREQELLLDYYGRLHMDDAHRTQDEAYLIELRSLADNTTGRYITIKEPLVSLVKRDVNRLKGEQLRIFRRAREEKWPAERLQAERMELESGRQKYVDVLTLFNRIGIRTTLGDLYDKSPESLDILRGYVKEILRRNREWAELNRRDLELSAGNTEIRDILGGGVVSLVLSLDLDWCSPRVGFGSADRWGEAQNWQAGFGGNTVRVSESLPGVAQEGKSDLLVDTLTRVGGLSEGYFFPQDSGVPTVYHMVECTPAFNLRNVNTTYGRAFLPSDTFDRLDLANLASITAYAQRFLRGVLADPHMTNPSELPLYGGAKQRKTLLWSVQVKTFQFDEFAASVLPSLPVPGSSVIIDGKGLMPNGVIQGYLGLTDARAATMVYGLLLNAARKAVSCSAFHYDADQVAVDYAVDAGEVHSRVSSNFPESENRRLSLFPCQELPIYVRDDPSLVSVMPITESTYHVLAGEHDSAPRKYGFTGMNEAVSTKVNPMPQFGPAALYLAAGERAKILTQKKRTVLNASEEEPEGIGYRTLSAMGPDFFAAAVRDMSVLNKYRIDNLRGVSDELAQDFRDRGDAAIERMESSKVEKDYLGALRNLYEALGSHVKAYEQTVSATNDMLKAVVFYMALMLPFCFFLQKLVFNFVKIEFQMLMFLLIFVVTFLVFRTIHPAFRIAQAPEAMFVAFVMGALGAFVINVLHGRFEGEMQLLFQTYSGMDTNDVTYSTAGQQAMLIGVNNMKRRRIRTALTTATIVLVTFTMLSFTSISKKMSPTMVAKSKAAPYTGLMYHWPALIMDEGSADVFSQLFAGEADVVTRRWLVSPRTGEGTGRRKIPIHVSCQPQGLVADMEAILGLSLKEDGFLDKIPLIPGGRYFSADDANEVIVPTGAADILGLTPDNLAEATLLYNGAEFKIVGILDDNRFRGIRDIDDKPLMPIDLEKTELSEADTAAAGLEEEGEAGAGVQYVDTASLLIMPVDTVGALGGKPYSLSVRFDDNEPIWPHVEKLLVATRAKFYVSSYVPFRVGSSQGREISSGAYYIGSGYRTSIGGLSVLIIPLLIASTIILNTMLGSVYERRSEIAIYNAVGLNPTHIGMFFLAEAFVYSVVGSVGGYLIGQVMSIVLNKFHLIQDINLNFSSLSVVYVILFTISIVMLSTLYPARVATKAAVPSGKRKWSMPAHDGTNMKVAFPFIYQEAMLAGIMAYIESYFSRFTEASIGDLIASPEGKAMKLDDEGRPTYELTYQVALAPFDLGVTQRMTFRGIYDEQVQSFRVFMELKRVSGQDTNWVATNKPFLERLRLYLMHWRNQEPATHAIFVQQGKQSFGEPGDTTTG